MLAAQLATIELQELIQIFRQFRFRTKKSTDAGSHHFFGRAWVGISALKVDKILRIRKIVCETFGDEQGQLGFANTAHAANTGDAGAAITAESTDQSFDLLPAANKVANRRAKLMQRVSGRACSLINVDVLVTGNIIAIDLMTAHILITGNNRAAFDFPTSNAAFPAGVDDWSILSSCRLISSASVNDCGYHRHDQRDRKHYPNPAIRPNHRFEITSDKITRNSADKKDHCHEFRY